MNEREIVPEIGTSENTHGRGIISSPVACRPIPEISNLSEKLSIFIHSPPHLPYHIDSGMLRAHSICRVGNSFTGPLLGVKSRLSAPRVSQTGFRPPVMATCPGLLASVCLRCPMLPRYQLHSHGNEHQFRWLKLPRYQSRSLCPISRGPMGAILHNQMSISRYIIKSGDSVQSKRK